MATLETKHQWLGPTTLDAIHKVTGYKDGAVAYLNGVYVGTVSEIVGEPSSRFLQVHVRLKSEMAASLTLANNMVVHREALPWRFVVENFFYVEGDRGYFTARGVVKISTSEYDTIVIYIKMLDDNWRKVVGTLKLNQVLSFDGDTLEYLID
jgi:hypothetical protein